MSGTSDPAVEALRAGLPVLLVDDRDPRRECVLVAPADAITPALVAWTVRHSSGCLSVALPAADCERLRLPLLSTDGHDPARPAFTVTVDARRGVGTGISATDRCRTIRLLAHPGAGPGDFTRPGHVMPVAVADDGVLARPGRAEAALDLVRMAGRAPAAVLADVVDADDGTCVGGPAGPAFAAAARVPVVTVAEVVAHRRGQDLRLRRLLDVECPLDGSFRAHGYVDPSGGPVHVALVLGDVRGAEDVPVRVHHECATGDLFGSRACDCRDRLRRAVRAVRTAGRGIVVYVRSDGADGGSLRCPATTAVPPGSVDVVAAILRDLCPASIRRGDPAPSFPEELLLCPSTPG